MTSLFFTKWGHRRTSVTTNLQWLRPWPRFGFVTYCLSLGQAFKSYPSPNNLTLSDKGDEGIRGLRSRVQKGMWIRDIISYSHRLSKQLFVKILCSSCISFYLMAVQLVSWTHKLTKQKKALLSTNRSPAKIQHEPLLRLIPEAAVIIKLYIIYC